MLVKLNAVIGPYVAVGGVQINDIFREPMTVAESRVSLDGRLESVRYVTRGLEVVPTSFLTSSRYL